MNSRRGAEPQSDEEVVLTLSKAEALVLHDWLARSSEADRVLPIESYEQRALWNLECILEKALVEPVVSNYPEQLAKAKKDLSN